MSSTHPTPAVPGLLFVCIAVCATNAAASSPDDAQVFFVERTRRVPWLAPMGLGLLAMILVGVVAGSCSRR